MGNQVKRVKEGKSPSVPIKKTPLKEGLYSEDRIFENYESIKPG